MNYGDIPLTERLTLLSLNLDGPAYQFLHVKTQSANLTYDEAKECLMKQFTVSQDEHLAFNQLHTV